MPAKLAVTDYLARSTLLRLLAVLTIVLAPHITRIPHSFSAGIVLVIGWRAAAALRQWPLPPQWLRTVITFLVLAAVYRAFGRVSGQNAGVAMLAAMVAMKLTEMRTRRDVVIVVFLMYFILITHFLFSQEIWTIGYLLVCAWLITALLIEVNHAGALSPRISLRMGSMLLAQSLPVMVVLFLLFPRLPGPLWGLPADSGTARSGLSDSMSPGDIASLIQSDAVAFRVRYLDAPPPNRERYWRGPVFDRFDGRSWSHVGHGDSPPPDVEIADRPTRYEVVLEPNNQNWLFGLDLVEPHSLPEDAHLNADMLIIAKQPTRDRRLYTLTSHTHYHLSMSLDPGERARSLRLPTSNPRTQALGQDWRAQGLDDEAIIARALKMYREENFHYSLEPPPLGRDPVDQFLFETRIGFCEHYASSFTVLMRAAGIPARIVTGYQGGDPNGVGDYYIVHQSDAHAWSEVWLQGRGWVRVDPTAAVAPERIEAGIRGALHGEANLPAYLDPRKRGSLSELIAARWDWTNTQWNRWVLGYGPELQAELADRFGLNGWRDLMLTATALLTLVLGATGYVLMRGSSLVTADDPAQRAWTLALKRLARAGIKPQPGEGPRDFSLRVCSQRPEWAASFGRFAALYLNARYLKEMTGERRNELLRAARQLRPVS